jgi:GAF domain-containing protein
VAEQWSDDTSLLGQVELLRARLATLGTVPSESLLARLYVASCRLHATLDRQDVIAAIQEIVTGLVRSREAALFEIDSAKQSLELAASFGLEGDDCLSIPLRAGLIGLTAFTGETLVVDSSHVSGATGLESRLTACVPLKLGGIVTGVIAIFGLLPPKSRLEEFDLELFRLLGTQAAFALYCTRLHAEVALEVERRW